ncbi:MAG: DUF799 family lipoprotein, partial [Deltaproteobacteria bacterium]|nr:DUF799 family lipoprotein [Deltaproteobacteria bacterium]
MRKGFFCLLSSVLFLAAACSLPTVRPNPSNPMYTVAVLPVYNATNDIDGAQKVRELSAARVDKWHYRSLPLNEVDQILRDQFNITLGSQLDTATTEQLGTALGVDGVMYGYLLNFEHITTGVYNIKKVRAGFKLVDARTGRVIWAGGHGVKSLLTSGGAAGKGVAALKELQDAREGMEPFKSIQGASGIPRLGSWQILSAHEAESVGQAGMLALGEKLVGKALGVHMRIETDVMLNMIFTDFPAGPGGEGFSVVRGIAPSLIKMPKIEAPRGGLTYFETGKRDFTADLVMTT